MSVKCFFMDHSPFGDRFELLSGAPSADVGA
jgi:hypothetical protein